MSATAEVGEIGDRRFCSIYSVNQKSNPPPKTCCNIFTQAKYISVTFYQFVASLYPHILTSFGQFIIIFNKLTLILLGALIVFSISCFEFHQIRLP